jgi:hypothetical protein
VTLPNTATNLVRAGIQETHLTKARTDSPILAARTHISIVRPAPAWEREEQRDMNVQVTTPDEVIIELDEMARQFEGKDWRERLHLSTCTSMTSPRLF